MSERIAKVNSLIQEELGKIIVKEELFPPDMMLTIISVETSVDLKHAKVKVDTVPPQKIGFALKTLESNIYDLQQALNKKLVMRYVPKIRFIQDEGQGKIERIEEVLKQAKKQDNV